MKIVINACYGGFGISRKAAEHMAANGSAQAHAELALADKEGYWHGYGYSPDGGYTEYKRDDPLLVAAVEALGSEANGSCAQLKVVEIPNGIDWEIVDYDGNEHIAQRHRVWS
jgi:hypothetical protein